MKEEKETTLLERYAKDPPEFSILVLLFNGTIKASEKGFLKVFAENKIDNNMPVNIIIFFIFTPQ